MKKDYSVLISSEDNNASSFPKQKKLTISKKEMQQYASRHNCSKDKRELTLCLSILQNSLNDIAKERNQSLAQMALSWVLKDEVMTSVLIGASKSSQVLDNISAIENTVFSEEELKKIDEIVKENE